MVAQRVYHSNVALNKISLDIEVKGANRIIWKMTYNRNFISQEYFRSKNVIN
jgi:hypothetical protein